MPLTDADLAWLDRTPFVSVRDRRDPAASPSERCGATPWGELESVTRDTARPQRFGLRMFWCNAVG